MLYRLCLLVLLLSFHPPLTAKTVFIPASAGETDCVVLLHGLARSAASMKRLQRALSAHGYAVLNVDYPSTDYTVETLVERYLRSEVEKLIGQSTCSSIHFVTHSMGGILVRYYLKYFKFAKLGRVVMISPPNQGSELVDKLGDFFPFRWLNGPAGAQLGTGENSLPKRLGPVDYDVAVIAGNGSLNPFYSYLIPGDDDGKVAVSRAEVEGMRAFKVVPKSHTFIVRNHTVINLVLSYLKSGTFLGAGSCKD